jgi:hypothetical protein
MSDIELWPCCKLKRCSGEARFFCQGEFYCYPHYINRAREAGIGVRIDNSEGAITTYREWLNPDGSVRFFF